MKQRKLIKLIAEPGTYFKIITTRSCPDENDENVIEYTIEEIPLGEGL